MKHYNRAHIFGILDKTEEQLTKNNGNPYLEVIIDCQHEEYGSVRVLAFIWGEENVNYFQSKFSRGDEVRLSGNMQQYTGRGKATRTTFNIYIIKTEKIKERKTTFILVGEVESLDSDGNLLLTVKQKKSEKYEAKEDTLKVHAPRELLLELENTPEMGQAVSVKGYIMCPEDEFGEPTGNQQPIVKELKFV